MPAKAGIHSHRFAFMDSAGMTVKAAAQFCESCCGLSRADRFDVVAVGIEQEGGVVGGAVVGAQAGTAVVAAAGLETRRVEAVDGGPIGRAERDMHALTCRAFAR